jgi:hypothetical protein
LNKVQSLIIILFLLAGLSMAGCSQQQAATDEASGATNGPGQTTMPLSTQLALGTLKLEGTETAVTAEQAVELLPLWKAAKTLSEADNVTSQELEAVFAQIQESMTGQQLSAIDEMDLSPQNMADLAQELGIEMPNRFGNLSPEMQSTLEAARASGQPPEGFTPGGGPGGGPPGGFDGGGGFAPPGGQAASGTQTPRQGNGNAAGAIFYQAVIDMLEKKVQ